MGKLMQHGGRLPPVFQVGSLRMTVHKKALFAIVTTLIVMTSIVFLISSSILMKSASRSEENQVNGTLRRVEDALSREVSMLDDFTRDYAAWDDSYGFIENVNAAYIKANCNDGTLVSNRFDFMVYADRSGRIVFGKSLDFGSGKEIPLPAGLQAYLAPGAALNNYKHEDEHSDGLLVLPGGPVLLAARPILTSESKGPIRGVLVLGRFFNEAELFELSKICSLAITYHGMNPDKQRIADDAGVLALLSDKNPTYRRVVDSNTVVGYRILLDLFGKPAGALSVNLPREYHVLLLQNLRISFLSLFFVSFVMTLLTLWLLDRLILRRLLRLSAFLKAVKSTDSLSLRVNITGTDELSQFGELINGMLETLEEDVAERKRAAEALRQVRELEMAKEAAEGASQAKNLFLANMTHELRTPLNGILGITEVVMDTELSKEQMDLLGTIRAEGEHLASIVNEVLDFSKIEAGRVELEEIGFDLRYLMDSITGLFTLQAEQKGVEFVSFLGADVPVMLVGDPGRLRQVLVNLIGNALKFTHEGRVSVRGELLEADAGKARVRFSVADTGIGIPKESIETIFESFTQAEKSTSRKYGGTGLGVTISKQIVELMGGQMGVESEPGGGSTFWLNVPFARQAEKCGLAETKGNCLEGLGVLVIDDVGTDSTEVATCLKGYGCCCVAVRGLEAALAGLVDVTSSGGELGVVIVHVGESASDGFGLAREIRELACFQDIPMVLIREGGEPGDVRLCREMGVQGYLTKTFQNPDLVGMITGIVSEVSARNLPEDAGEVFTKHSVREAVERQVRILLVEDYPTNQQVATKHLTTAGYLVDLAENGQLAVDAWKRGEYDLILMDVQMPVMDGIEATRTIRDLEDHADGAPARRRVPIVALTANSVPGILNCCKTSGIDDCLMKPLRKQVLLTMVEKWTERFRDKKVSDPGGAGTVEPEAPKAQVMDFDRCVEEFGGDRGFVMDTCLEFINHVRGQILLIEDAIRNGDGEVVRGEAHSIKGGASNLTAVDLAGKAHALECIGKTGALGEAPSALRELQAEYVRLVGFISTLETAGQENSE